MTDVCEGCTKVNKTLKIFSYICTYHLGFIYFLYYYILTLYFNNKDVLRQYVEMFVFEDEFLNKGILSKF